MGTLGFSYLGMLFLLMLFIPNALWTKCPPDGYDSLARTETGILPVFERIGQVSVTTAALIFSDLNPHGGSPWSLWLLAAFLLMVLYDICWYRYLTGPHTLAAFYGNQFGIPVPLALLPVTAFFLLGIYGRVVWLLAADVLLGIGHIGIHLRHRNSVFRQSQ